MKVSEFLRRSLRRLNLPLGLLVILLQRTPAVRAVAGVAESIATSRPAEILRAAIALGSLGAMHSLAGATTYIQSPANPVKGEVGTRVTVAFTFTGAPSDPQYWMVLGGALPPGVNFIPAPLNGVIRTRDPAISGTPTQPGTFTVRVKAVGLAGESDPVDIRFDISGAQTPVPPTIAVQPQSQTVPVGAGVSFAVQAAGTPAPTFQWMKNGANILGATGATFAVPSVQPGDAGTYAVVVSNSAGTVTSAAASLSIAGANVARLSNLSVRTVMAAGQTLIVGATVAGGPRDILVRAAGPALGAFGLTGAMSDPRLELYDAAGRILENDDWPATLAATFGSVGAFPFAVGSRDAAFVKSMDGGRTIQARGTAAGAVLVEAYDIGSNDTPRLINVSARNRVGTGDDILIAGFTIAGQGTKRVLIRAIGPKLAAFGVTGFLVDPKLAVFGGSGQITENDNWPPALAADFTVVGAFGLDTNSRDAALIATLAPGSYTAQVSGVNNGTGEALVEIYELP